MNNEMRKKSNLVKNLKKSWSQLVLIFETYDPGHEAETDPIKEKP
jgi:hypothetical protein